MTGSAISSAIRTELDALSTLLDFITTSRWAQRGDNPNGCDFVLGNPHEPVLPGLTRALQQAIPPQRNDWHAYTMSDAHSCEVVAASLAAQTGVPFDPADISMTNGAFTGLAVATQTVVEPGDEVIYNSPPWFFYGSFIRRAGAVPVPVSINWETLELDLDAIEAAITPRTRAIIVNSPHNPTGKIYSTELLQALADLLRRASEKNGRPIFPYFG